ncbi:MAG: MBOAT family protein [Acidobacteriota bacterium]|nr:MBOAT family protein [Acidobacteriota bacterium]
MLLSSAPYFVFLGAVFVVYWLSSRSRLGALLVVLAANYFFYGRWDLAYLILIPAASTVDFLLARAMDRGGPRRLWVTLSILQNVGLIASLKYLPLLTPWHWALPLGVSFYAFQSMTYTIDVYRRDAKPTSDYLAYLCSASFFPTTLAGPITRIATLLPQWDKRALLAPSDGGKALFLIGLGLVKKLLIADYLGENLINRVFDTPKLYSGTETLAAVYGYAFQIYYDFSGYTDIAIGSALLLGIRLPVNFNRPYAAENIANFWRRWHISLSNWLRDYLYFSLPGQRSRWKVFAYLNLIVTMAIGGFWHGASWTFLAWGLLHGIGLATHRLFQAIRPIKPSPAPLARFARRFATFHFVVFAWIFFRAPSVDAALEVLQRIASLSVSFVNVTPGFAVILALAACAHFLPQGWYQRSLDWYCKTPFYVQGAALALLAIGIQYIAATGAAPFIYTKF